MDGAEEVPVGHGLSKLLWQSWHMCGEEIGLDCFDGIFTQQFHNFSNFVTKFAWNVTKMKFRLRIGRAYIPNLINWLVLMYFFLFRLLSFFLYFLPSFLIYVFFHGNMLLRPCPCIFASTANISGHLCACCLLKHLVRNNNTLDVFMT